jgi:hypothetical protein
MGICQGIGYCGSGSVSDNRVYQELTVQCAC